MLRWRVSLGLTLVALLIGACVADASWPGAFLGPISLAITLLASGEAVALSRASGLKPLAPLVHAGNVAVVASAWLPLMWPRWVLHTSIVDTQVATLDDALRLVAPPVAVLLACVLLALLVEIIRFRTPGGVVLQLAGTVWPLVYVGWLFSFLPSVRSLDLAGAGVAALLSMVAVVKLGDTGAYTVGRLIGRHKLAPHLSPGKTIEGAIGGLALSAFGAWLALAYLWSHFLSGGEAGLGKWLPFGLLVGAAGMVGDLAESLLKRDARVKDSSAWLPGFGGVLDIVDSLLFAAPVAYVVLVADILYGL